jgi:biofilm protein TabA
MIIDQLDNRQRYPYGNAWTVAFDFLLSLRPNAEERRYDLQDDMIYAMIESYHTKPPQDARPESHRQFVDIQMLLLGAERIDWWPTPGLTTVQPFAPGGDIAFYDQPEKAGIPVALVPGRFAAFFPEDAHMPGLQLTDSPTPVKKVVVKIDASLL